MVSIVSVFNEMELTNRFFIFRVLVVKIVLIEIGEGRHLRKLVFLFLSQECLELMEDTAHFGLQIIPNHLDRLICRVLILLLPKLFLQMIFL